MPPLEAVDAQDASLESLRRFYRLQAPIYDFSRIFILFGRSLLIDRLDVRPAHRVLDVGCGTGWNFAPLVAAGAEVVGIECSAHMRKKAERRAERLGGHVRIDPRPYGADLGEAADRIVFSYSLSMMDRYRSILERAREGLRPGGAIGVVDFLDATNAPTRAWLRASHVFLGTERLRLLMSLFPNHDVQVFWAALWHYFVFVGSPEGPVSGSLGMPGAHVELDRRGSP